MSLGTGLEGYAADEFIYGTLINDATLLNLLNQAYANNGSAIPAAPEIYADTITPDVTYPYVIFQFHTPMGDMETQNGEIVFSVMDYLVRVVDRSQSYGAIAPIYKRVHQLLHQQSGVVPDGIAYNCRRIRPFKQPQLDDAIQYRIIGGFYRLTVQA